MGERWFRLHSQPTQSAAEIAGQPTTLDAALDQAVSLLEKADYPLIYGLSRSVTPGQAGADNALCWQTGLPFAVDLSRGYPRYNPGEFTADELLAEGNTDLCVLVGAETVPFFSDAARRRLEAIPTIVLDYPHVPLDFVPTLRFNTSVYGLHSAGTAYRMDNVPVSLGALRDSDCPTDEYILSELESRCRLGSTPGL